MSERLHCDICGRFLRRDERAPGGYSCPKAHYFDGDWEHD